jgi:hypothetical protein
MRIFLVMIMLVGHHAALAADKHIPKIRHKIYKKVVVIGKTALPKDDDKLARPAGMP